MLRSKHEDVTNQHLNGDWFAEKPFWKLETMIVYGIWQRTSKNNGDLERYLTTKNG
jgi:hypothetical protein